ncbi:hypothetical protein K438DRAFT_1926203 [Mycena galopus ATCC 62051]|nr:hypothetical protein K438DRAFT_1926203 [Mycena galopus ATCC 62051]
MVQNKTACWGSYKAQDEIDSGIINQILSLPTFSTRQYGRQNGGERDTAFRRFTNHGRQRSRASEAAVQGDGQETEAPAVFIALSRSRSSLSEGIFAKKQRFLPAAADYKLYRDYQPFKFGNRDIQQRHLGSGEMAPGRKLRVRSWVIPDLVRRVKGADVNFAEGDFTPLFHATENMNLELIRCLLASGADPNLQGTVGDLVSLFSSARHADMDAIQTLLAGGANLHVKGNRTSWQKSRTSRYSASSLNAFEVAVEIISRGGSTPVDTAMHWNNPEAVKILEPLLQVLLSG